MASNDNFSYTTLGASAQITLEINGKQYPIAQAVTSFAINQIPEAVCMMAVGRDARTLEQALIHADSATLKSMLPAKIHFQAGTGSQFNIATRWPSQDVVIFEGYYVGYGYQKANGKVSFVIHLIHWLADLGFSSCLSAVSHPSNPVDLTFPGIMSSAPLNNTVGMPGAFVANLIGAQLVASQTPQDLWGAIQSFLCAMTQYKGFSPTASGTNPIQGVIDVLQQNNRAASALSRIEGPGGQCGPATAPAAAAAGVAGAAAAVNSPSPAAGVPYKYGMPLKLNPQLAQAYAAIGQAVCGMLVNSGLMSANAVHQTMWDVLIGYYCPLFGLDLCPAIDRAMVVASTPGYRGQNGNQWITLLPDEYDWVDDNAMLPKPLRGVVAHGSAVSDGGIPLGESATGGYTSVIGAFASGSVDDADGAILYVPVPDWIGQIVCSGANANISLGTTQMNPTNTATTAGAAGGAPGENTPQEMADNVQPLINAYAQTIFIQNALRGRSGTMSGKLRMDIAPGSHVKIKGSPEQIIDNDDLSGDRYGQVNRVTVEINAESRRAATGLVISELRNETENQEDRTSIAAHPFYGASVMLGAPLTPAMDLGETAATGPTLISGTPGEIGTAGPALA